MHSTVCTVIDLFMCVCHIVLINYYYYYYLAVLHNNDINDTWRQNNTQTIIRRRAHSLHPSRIPTIYR